MITYEWDHNDLAYVQRKLGDMSAKAPIALRDAINNTAVTARKKLLQEAQKRYTVKASGFNSRANIVKATVATQTAWIKVKGSTLTMGRYHYSKPKSGVKSEILTGSGLKTVVGPRGIKAFIAKGLIFQREGKSRLPIKALRSPSVPKQIEMVYDGRQITSTPLKKEIEQLYHANVEKQIKRFLQ